MLLVGAPGEDSPAGRDWRREADRRGVGEAIAFSGALPAQALADALAACDVLLSINAGGPTSRKGSLAGSLSSGRPVVAVDGPRRWSELHDGEALRVVEPSAEALASVILALLEDPSYAAELGARGRHFAEHEMGVARTTEALAEVLRRSVSRRH
jgi:glycosyltransferase involved in cell wall biosynthesis